MKKTLAGFLLVTLAATPGAGAPQEETSSNGEAYFHFARARALELNGDWDGAVEAFDQALALDPFDSAIYSELALAYAARNDGGSAIDYAERAILMDPDNLDAHRLLSRIYTTLLANSETGFSRDVVNLAVEELEHVVRLDPAERGAYLTLGRLYRIMGDPERAMAVYRDFMRVEPSSEEGAISLAELQIEAGNVDEAISILRDFVGSQSDSDRALILLGDAYIQAGDYGSAANTLGIAAERSPDDLDLLRKLAEALFLANRLDEAAARFEAVLEQEPDDPVTRLRLGQIYRQQMEYEKARENLEVAIREVPNSAEIRFEAALLDRDEGRFEAAQAAFRDLLEDTARSTGRYTPAESQTRQRLMTHIAIIQTLMGRYEDAVRTFEDMKSLMQGRDDGSIDSYIVDTLRTDGDARAALDHAAAARRSFPENRQLRVVEADLIAEVENFGQGVTLLREMLAGSEEDRDVYSTLVGAYERIGDYESAQNVLDEMIESLEDDETAWFLQGALYERQENIEAAERAFRSALEIDADNPATLNYLGYMLADRNRNLEEALTMIQAAVAADPINGAYLDSLGWVYFRLEQMDLAEEFLTRAVLFSDSDPTLHEHLGDLYERIGRIGDAREAYQRSMERAEDEEERERVRRKLEELNAGTI